MAPNNYVQPPTTAEWNKVRPVFIKLYSEENLSLPDVMNMLEKNHDFKASQKMYKNKIKAWGIKKYLRAAEAEALANGDSSDEKAQKAKRSLIRRQARAKTHNRASVRERSHASEEPPQNPPAHPPTSSSATPQVIIPQLNHITSTSFVTEPSPIQTELQRPWSPPRNLGPRRETITNSVIDQFLVNLRAWTHHAYVSGHWERSASTQHEKARDASRLFASDLQAGIKWLEQGKSELAWVHWRSATRHFENPDLFRTWYHETPVRLLFEIARIRRSNEVFAGQLLAFVGDWAEAHLDKSDKRCALYKFYGQIEVSELQEFYERAARCLLDGLTSRLDKHDPLLFEVRLNRALDMIWFDSTADLTEWLPPVEQVDEALGRENRFSIYYLLLQAYREAAIGDFTAVDKTVTEARHRIEVMPPGNLDGYKLGMAYRRLGRVQHEKMRYQEARRSFNTAYRYLKGGKHAEGVMVEILQCQESMAKATGDLEDVQLWTDLLQEQEDKLKAKNEEMVQKDMALLERHHVSNTNNHDHLSVIYEGSANGSIKGARSPSPIPGSLSRRGTL